MYVIKNEIRNEIFLEAKLKNKHFLNVLRNKISKKNVF